MIHLTLHCCRAISCKCLKTQAKSTVRHVTARLTPDLNLTMHSLFWWLWLWKKESPRTRWFTKELHSWMFDLAFTVTTAVMCIPDSRQSLHSTQQWRRMHTVPWAQEPTVLCEMCGLTGSCHKPIPPNVWKVQIMCCFQSCSIQGSPTQSIWAIWRPQSSEIRRAKMPSHESESAASSACKIDTSWRLYIWISTALQCQTCQTWLVLQRSGHPKGNVAFFDTEIAHENLKTGRTSACSCKGCWPKKVNPIRVRSSVLVVSSQLHKKTLQHDCQAKFILWTWLCRKWS